MRQAIASLVLLLPLALAAGCPPATGGEGEGETGEGEGDVIVGEGEGEVVGEGEGEEPPPPPPPPPNDTCATAEAITAGTKSGTTIGAGSETPCAAGFDFLTELPGGADVAYTFTLDADHGIHVSVDGDIDGVVSVFDDVACGSGADSLDETDRVCVDNGSPEEINIGLLPAGTYFIVVESYSVAGDFDLSLDIVDPFCVGDRDDLSDVGNTADTAVALNRNSFNIGGLSQNADSADVDFGFDVTLCDGDEDHYLFAHLGGPMTLASTAGVLRVNNAVVDVEATKAQGFVAYTEGEVIDGVVGTDVDVAAGLYLVTVTEDADLGITNLDYDIAISHQCEGDDFDFPDADVDAFFETQNEPIAVPLDFATERTICGADIDIVDLDVIFEGQVAITFSGDVGRDLTVDLVSIDADGTETAVVSNRVDDDVANTLTVAADVVPGHLQARVSGPGITATGAYAWTVALPGLDGVPANDLCDAAEVLPVGVAVGGRTVGANDDFDGVGPVDTRSSCNFEFDGVEPGDVFYSFSLPAAVDTQIVFTGLAGYGGTAALLRMPDTGCPADLSTLEPVPADGADLACLTTFGDPLRIRGLAAGDYLIVVDDFSFSSPGLFRLQVDTFVDGFPPPPACLNENIQPIDLTADVQTIDLVGSDFFAGELDAGSCNSGGNEKVFTFVPQASGTLTARTLQRSDFADFDTVLMLRTDCLSDTDEVCDDDGAGGPDSFDSILTTPVVAGTPYFLVVDGFSPGNPGPDATVTLEAFIAP